jgi:hypothetical protein
VPLALRQRKNLGAPQKIKRGDVQNSDSTAYPVIVSAKAIHKPSMGLQLNSFRRVQSNRRAGISPLWLFVI